ncbi:MAG: hydrogenase maturation protease [Methylococcaceae bacterium]|nr:hydrogenase maturation protease [Methylococcaceae bacterium]
MNTRLAEKLLVKLADYNNATSLIYGIGNVGRQDDGLGWAFIDWLEEESICPKAELMRHYQLHLEDADLISYKKQILFVDATKALDVESFQLEKMEAKMDFSFSSHAISIPSIMAICQQCFDKVPVVRLLTIKGYEWELQLGLTEKAKQNLLSATDFFRQQEY